MTGTFKIFIFFCNNAINESVSCIFYWHFVACEFLQFCCRISWYATDRNREYIQILCFWKEQICFWSDQYQLVKKVIRSDLNVFFTTNIYLFIKISYKACMLCSVYQNFAMSLSGFVYFVDFYFTIAANNNMHYSSSFEEVWWTSSDWSWRRKQHIAGIS